ncbi:EAL domain-containing protein, partial [Duganella sp. FT134W]
FGAACRAAAGWRAPDGAPLQLAINISPSQLRERALVDVITQALHAAGLPPQQLCLEITEHLMLDDTARNRDVLAALKALGVKVSIDDFGTGYSSLSYLGRLRVDEMKIDRSLTEHVCADSEHAAIVRAAVAMAHSLQLGVVSEGVENAQQHALLRAIG